MDELKSLIARLHNEKYPEADVIFLAGSVIRGEGTKTSDLDIVVIYSSIPNAYRDSYRDGDSPRQSAVVLGFELFTWYLNMVPFQHEKKAPENP